MLLIILGLLDVIMGVFLALSGPMQGVVVLVWLGIIVVIKGIYSVLSNAASGFFFDLMGILDLLVGIFLVLAYYGIYSHFFIYVGILMALKGVYSIIMGLTSS